jgi:hypothetical protein
MSKMNKVVITEFGDESKLAVVEDDLPDPGAGEVQLSVEYSIVSGSAAHRRTSCLIWSCSLNGLGPEKSPCRSRLPSGLRKFRRHIGYVVFDFAESCVFVKQLQIAIHCDRFGL